MKENEKRFLEILGKAKDPEQAAIIAIEIISDYLLQLQSEKERKADSLPEHG